MTMDMFPTFAGLAGADMESLALDGVDVSPALFEGQQLDERLVGWKIGEDKALRQGSWKLCMVENEEPQLFNLANDLGEQHDVSERHPDKMRSLLSLYDQWEKDVTSGY
jgi:arylsulfatase A-like enzyme